MTPSSAKGIGAALARKEDDRFLRGHGEYVGDVQLDGMLEVAFVRSPVAHGRLRAVIKPAGAEDRVFTAADLHGVQPIKAVSGLPGFKVSEQAVLASGKVR